MKKYIFLLCASFTFSLAQSQEIRDAVRYAQDNLNGTARFRAMGGAFGALGGDLSAITINPAGSAVFSNNQFALTLTNFNTKNHSDYFRTNTSDSDNSFELNQTGGVFVFKNPYNNWRKFSFSINYENINNFDNSVFSAGVNPTNSVDGYFLNHANFGNGGLPVPQEFVTRQTGESITELYSYLGSNLPNYQYPHLSGFAAQQAMIAFYEQGYIIEAEDLNNPNSKYVSKVTPGGNYYQENSIYTNGYNGKLSFNLASSYKDKLFIGINLNSHFTNYYQSTSFYERNNNPLSTNYTVQRINFNNNLHTYGNGFSFQIGTIAKVTEAIRLGLSYESNTWYNLTDEFSQDLVAVSANTSETLAPDVVNPAVINYYSPYDLQTPDKWRFSFAYVFGKNGLISIDYGVRNYGKTKYKPENDSYFRDLNQNIKNTLGTSNELKIGAEYKIKALSIRGGYRFDESPYKNGRTVGDLNSFSGGLGYNFRIFKMDFAYTHAERSSEQGFFDQGFTDGARVNAINNNFTMTFAFEL